MTPDTDALLERVASGDPAAKAALFDRHRDRLRRMLLVRMDRRIRNRVDPSDIVQETLLMADRKLDEFLRSRPVPFYPWLRKIAWDQLVDCHRKHLFAARRSRRREQDYPELSDESIGELATRLIDNQSDPLQKAIRSELQERVRTAMDRLPETYREILVLRYLEQLSSAETAAVLNIGISTVKMRLFRAVERLRALLDNPSIEGFA